MHVFAGQVKNVSRSSCSTSAILKYFCHLDWQCNYFIVNIMPRYTEEQ